MIAKVVEGVDITKADILVGAGRGAEDCLDMVQAVAEELGGELCCFPCRTLTMDLLIKAISRTDR